LNLRVARAEPNCSPRGDATHKSRLDSACDVHAFRDREVRPGFGEKRGRAEVARTSAFVTDSWPNRGIPMATEESSSLVVAARPLGQEAIKSSAAEQVAAPRAEYAIVSVVSVA
jgi:hypothetical protein